MRDVAAPGDDRDEAMPIVLDLVDPAIAGRRVIGRGDELERDAGWERGRARAGGKGGFGHRREIWG